MNDLMLGGIIGFVAGTLVTGAACTILKRRAKSARPVSPRDLSLGDESDGTVLLDQLFAKTETAESLRQNLRVKYLHSEQGVDEAIALERQRAPHASETELMQAAIERWERDNR